MKQTVLIDIMGDSLLVEDKAEIKLYPGLNLIGVPVKDERLNSAGDLLSLALALQITGLQ